MQDKYKKYSDFNKAIEFVKNDFEKGSVIEPFVILFSILEAELLTAWYLFLLI